MGLHCLLYIQNKSCSVPFFFFFPLLMSFCSSAVLSYKMCNSFLSNQVETPAIANHCISSFHGCRKSLSRILTSIFSKQCQQVNGYNWKYTFEISAYCGHLFLKEIHEESKIGNFSHKWTTVTLYGFLFRHWNITI